jgi:hypothetical protein
MSQIKMKQMGIAVCQLSKKVYVTTKTCQFLAPTSIK